jgi:hypothetical protein
VHIAGPFTIASMYCFAIVVAVLNTTYLPLPLRMPRWKLLGMYWAVVLWGWFSAEQVSRSLLEHGLGLSGPVVTSIALHPVRLAAYGAWLGSLGWLVWRTAGPGILRRSR